MVQLTGLGCVRRGARGAQQQAARAVDRPREARREPKSRQLMT